MGWCLIKSDITHLFFWGDINLIFWGDIKQTEYQMISHLNTFKLSVDQFC